MSSHDARYEDGPAYDEESGTTTTRPGHESADESAGRDAVLSGGPVLLPVDPEPEPTDKDAADTAPDSAPVTIVDRKDADADADADRKGLTTDGTDVAGFTTNSAGVTTDSSTTPSTSDSVGKTDTPDVTDGADSTNSTNSTDSTVGPDTETGALKDPVPDGAFSSDAAFPTSAPASRVDDDWRELQGRFVDDPQAAVKEAADKVEKALSDLRSKIDTGSTEDLRTAFRRYRDLHAELG